MLASIQAMTYLYFGIVVIVNLILYRVHPFIGLAGTVLLIAYLMHWI